MRFFDKEYSFDDVRKRVGCLDQVAGVRRFAFVEGKSKGVEAAEIRTGSGLAYNILLDRGMDIYNAEFKGIPVTFISPVGVTAPSFYESTYDQWLRSFSGGLLTTCGLTNVGNPCKMGNEKHGLHGRISNLPAEKVCINEGKNENEYIISVSGIVRQAKTNVENIEIHRKIKSVMGKSKIMIEDRIFNNCFDRTPFMILYHCNFGFPLINEKCRIVVPNQKVESMFPELEWDVKNYCKIESPKEKYHERVFHFSTIKDREDFSYAMIVNDKDNPTLALKLKYSAEVLNNLSMWKDLSYGDYVLGIEPCNNRLQGIKSEQESGSIAYLEALEEKSVFIEMEFIEDETEINSHISFLEELDKS